jgi:CRP-like cAMP-binding protein
MAVRDGRRLITTLRKADTFGEWGISHQRGVRAADVVAARDSQCLRFPEVQYWRLVQRYPIIQERIGKIRTLLPRLEMARTRAQRTPTGELPTGLSVITAMTTSQLAAIALFGEVRTYRWGQSVVQEGDPADGLYILLSGHLLASVRAGPVGELSEGEIFGEIGLLEGGRRSATVTVVSADAEVLFMSRVGFERLLEAVPAFSWGIREAATVRRGASGTGHPQRSEWCSRRCARGAMGRRGAPVLVLRGVSAVGVDPSGPCRQPPGKVLYHGHQRDGGHRLHEVAVEVRFESSRVFHATAVCGERDHGKATKPRPPRIRAQAAREFHVECRHLDVAKDDIRIDGLKHVQGGRCIDRDGDTGALILEKLPRGGTMRGIIPHDQDGDSPEGSRSRGARGAHLVATSMPLPCHRSRPRRDLNQAGSARFPRGEWSDLSPASER